NFDLRPGRILGEYTLMEFFQVDEFGYRIGGILPHSDYLLQQEVQGSGSGFVWGFNSYGYWDSDSKLFDKVVLNHADEYYIMSPSIYLPACDSLQLFATG